MSSTRIVILFSLCCLAVVLWAEPVTYGITLSGTAIPSVQTLAAVQATGAGMVVLQAEWPRVQPTPTTWDFDELDTVVEAAVAKGLTVVLTLGPAPRWAVRYLSSPTAEELTRAKPDPAALRAYAAALARRYQAKVKYYRIWEPPTAAVLLAIPRDVHALYRAAAAGIHGVNPALKVIAPEPGDVSLEWIATYLAGAKGAAAPDILSLTPSRYVTTPEAFWWRCNVLRARVLPATNAPALWAEMPNGEHGSRLAAAALVQKIATVLFPQGSDGVPDALLRLRGSSYHGWSQVSLGAIGGVFQGDGCRYLLEVPLVNGSGSAGVPVVREMQNSGCQPGTPVVAPHRITAHSVTLDVSGQDATAIRPLREISGGQYTLKYLGTQPVLVTERDVEPWLHFDVPDGFLFYNRERVPVEVTVQLYGARRREKTGFNLYYDAIGGMNNAPWQWIGVGQAQIFTYTFRLNDALFSNREGYDIRICSGGSEDDLRVVGISVKKVK